LPEALNHFLKTCPEATVRLIGPDTASSPDGGSMEKWMGAHLAADIRDRVAFVGEQSGTELAKELAAASFVVVPSLFDSYSYVCCESLAAGRPVVVSDNIGATEVVADGGLAFQRNNPSALAAAMERLWRDRPMLLRLANAASERGRHVLGARATIQRRIDFYQQVIERSAARLPSEERFSRMPPQYIAPLLRAISQVTMFLAGVPDASHKTPGMRLTAILDSVSGGKPAKTLLYGAGRHTSRLLAEKHLWESKGHRVVGLIDDHPRFASTQPGAAAPQHLGLPVESRAVAEGHAAMKDVAVVLSTDTFEEQFWEQTAGLRARGVRVFKLYG
jgi:hypothetical protein